MITIRRLRAILASKKVRFIVAGVLNTGIDFVIFNTAIIAFGFKPWLANICSTTVAMALSFFVNKHLVFRDQRSMNHAQFAAFIVVTAAGLWGLQTGIIALLNPVFGTIGHQAISSRQHMTIISWLAANAAKLTATVASTVWNYLWYDYVIFTNSGKKRIKMPRWL